MDFLLRIHVTKMLQGINISLRSSRNLFFRLAPAHFYFRNLPVPPPLIKKWNVPSFTPNTFFFSLTLNSKIAQRWGRGLGGVNRV